MRSTLLILSVLTILCAPAHANWVDDYFNNAVTTNPAAFKSQQRGYYTAGGFTSRVPYKAEPIMNISLPSISAGCGGIDMFWGGVSFMNAEYMVKKAEGILKNAPYVLFSLAIKALSSQFGDTMEAVQAIVDQLNSMQIDECAAAKNIIQIASGDGENSGLMNEFSRLKDNAGKLAEGIGKSYDKVTKQTANDPKTARENTIDKKLLDPKLKALLKGKGWLLDTLADASVFNVLYANEINGLRALVGDIYFDNMQPVQKAEYLQGCAITYSFDEYLTKKVTYQTSADLEKKVCSYGVNSLETMVTGSLNNIFDAFSSSDTRKQDINASDINLISKADIPILKIMTTASYAGDEYLDATKSIIGNVAASSIAYGSLKNLFIVVSSAIYDIENKVSQEEVYTDIILAAMTTYQEAIRNRLNLFEKEYAIKLQAYNSSFSMALNQQSIEKDLVEIRKAFSAKN